MLDVLKFVKGATSRKDFVPEMAHFRIRQGRITSYNGRMSLSSPIPLDIDCCPKSETFRRAIESCEREDATTQIHLTPSGKLAVRCGGFRTHVEVITDTFTGLDPEGQLIQLDGKLLPVLNKLVSVVGNDATRPYSNGILFNGHSALATNNVVLVEHWLGYFFPFVVNVPEFAIKELLRIKEEPEKIQVTADSATFHFSGSRWLKTQLLSTKWPESLPELLAKIEQKSGKKLPATLMEALDNIKPFLDDFKRVYFLDNAITTTTDGEGTTIEVAGLPAGPIFNAEMLRTLETVADYVDFSTYPAVVPFFGKNTRGAIVGMRA